MVVWRHLVFMNVLNVVSEAMQQYEFCSLTFEGLRGKSSGFSSKDSDSQSEICCPLSFSTSSSDSSRSVSVSITGRSSKERKEYYK